MKAWHFVGATLRDGQPVPADGVTLKFDGKPILCKQGLHASVDPFDALEYAPGATLCLVECGGEIVLDTDKLVCTERTIIARMDATDMLRYFARMQALSVVHLWDAPDVVLDYLMTGDESIRAAAWYAAWAPAWAPAWLEARDAASASVWAAAWLAARAARNAAGDAARADFNALVAECFSDFLEEK